MPPERLWKGVLNAEELEAVATLSTELLVLNTAQD